MPESVRLGPPKECFANARDLSEHNPDLKYCEGYVLLVKSDGQPTAVRHGWCCDANDKAVDPTTLRDGAQAVAYLGVSFSEETVRHVLSAHKLGKVLDVQTIDELDRLLDQ